MRRKGNDPTLLIGLLAVLMILHSLYTPSSSGPDTVAAGTLADQVKAFPVVNDTQCEGVSGSVSNSITILQDMNGAVGTGFKTIQFDASNCDIAIQYLPVLGTYNSFILASRAVNPNNATSVKVFYEDAFLLSSDVIIINDKVAYNIAFKSTGEMNDALGLARLRSLCGDECYRVVLSGIHWTIRVYMDQFLCDFESWAIPVYSDDFVSPLLATRRYVVWDTLTMNCLMSSIRIRVIVGIVERPWLGSTTAT